MSYIDDELKIDISDDEEEEDVGVEETLNDPLLDIPEEDDLLDDELVGLNNTEY